MTSRPRRANAGANMHKLMEDAEEADEFYKEKYGGFADVEDDSDFAQSEASDDVVDSDFDLSENDVEQDDEANEREVRKEERAVKRKAHIYKDSKVHRPPVRRKKMSDVNNLPKKPVNTISKKLSKSSKHPNTEYSRTLRQSTHQMTFDRIERENRTRRKRQRRRKNDRVVKLTQEELMEEARITEVENTLWLEKFKNLDIEKSKKRPERDFKQSKDFTIQHFGYLENTLDPETGKEKSIIRSVISFPGEEIIDRYFSKPETLSEMPDPKVCWVTGLPAKYKDPVTGLPYYNIQAFQVIRKLYYRYLEKSPQFKDNERVREYLNNVNENSEPLKMFSFGTETKPRYRYETIQEYYDKPVQLNINPSRNRTVNLGVNSSAVLGQSSAGLCQSSSVHQVQIATTPTLSSLSSASSSSLSSNVQLSRPPFTVQQTPFSSPQKGQQNILQLQATSVVPTTVNNQQSILQQQSQSTNILQQQNLLQKQSTQIGQLQSQQASQGQNILQNVPKQTIQLQAQITQQQPIQTLQVQTQPQIQTIQIPAQQTHIQIQQPQSQSSQIQLQAQSQSNSQQQQQVTQQIQLQSQQQTSQQQPMKMYITAVANNDNAYIIPRTPQDASNSFVNINSIQNPPPSK